MQLKPFIGKLVFSLAGWTYEINTKVIDHPKNVMIGFTHTSNLDTILGIALLNIKSLKFHVLVKQEAFKWPIGGILRKLGCLPVDRKNSKNIVLDMVNAFNHAEHFNLVIAPEATRIKDGEKPPIRTGFWHIAKAANVPIVLMYAMPDQKKGGIFERIWPSDSIDDDLLKIKQIYADIGIDIIIPEPSTPKKSDDSH